MNTNIWRVTGIVLMVGLSVFLLSRLLKLLLITGVAVLLVRVVGGQLARRFNDRTGRVGMNSTSIISIDNPTYRPFANRVTVDRVISIG